MSARLFMELASGLCLGAVLLCLAIAIWGKYAPRIERQIDRRAKERRGKEGEG